MIGKAIYNILINNATVTGYVGARIYPVVIPQKAGRPCIVWRLISKDPNETKQTVSAIDHNRFEVFILDNEYDKTGRPPIYDIARAVRVALDKKQIGTYNGVEIGEMNFETERDDYDEELENFMRVQNYRVFSINA